MAGSQNWWYRYTQDGRRISVSLRTPDEPDAIKRASAIKAQGLIAAAAYTPGGIPPRKREVHGVIDQYLKEAQTRHKKPLRPGTAATHRYILNKFVSECGIERIGDITRDKINQWFKQLKAEEKSADTVWTYGQRVRSFIVFLVPKYLPATFLEAFTLPEVAAIGRKNFIRKEEVTRIIDAAKDDPILTFCLYCGFDTAFRRMEVSEALVGWFDLEANGGVGVADISNNENFTTKDRSNRTIELTGRFRAFLKTFLAGRNPREYVLEPKKTERGKSKYRYDTSKRVRSHFERCNVTSTQSDQGEATYHDMRRSFASNRASANTSIYKIARWLGDGLEVVENSYGHLVPQGNEIENGV